MPASCRHAVALLSCLALSACEGDFFLFAGEGTLLVGVVTRSPTQPVCHPDLPCDAPFSSGFTATRDGRVVAAFHSGADGRFRVALPAGGTFRIVPGPDAPLLEPTVQSREVSVREGEVNEVALQFDTGIR